MMKISHFAAIAVLSAVAAIPCGAWTIFGSKEDALKDKLRDGDKLMQKADAAFEAGKMSRAGDYYDRAIRKYGALNEAAPDFMDGIAALRLAYCAKQYTNVLEAVEAAVEAIMREEEEGTGNGEEGTVAPDATSASLPTQVESQKSKVESQMPEAENPRPESTKPQVESLGGDAAPTRQTVKSSNRQPDAADATSAFLPAQVESQKSKVESQKSEVESQKSEVESQMPETESPKPEAENQMPETESPKPEADAAPPPRPAYDPRNFPHDFAEARMLMEDGNLSEAAAVLIPMLRHDPANRQVRLLLAIVRTRQSRYDEAIVALEDLRGIREDMPILLALAGAYMGAARYYDALLTLDRAVKLNPSDPSPYMNLAWLTLVMPQEPDTLKNAETNYRQAIKRGATRDRALEARIGLTQW